MQIIRYLSKCGDPCEVHGKLFDGYLTLADGEGFQVPYQKILTVEEVGIEQG